MNKTTRAPYSFRRTVRSLFRPGSQFFYGALATVLVVEYAPIRYWIIVIVAATIGTGINVLWTRLTNKGYL